MGMQYVRLRKRATAYGHFLESLTIEEPDRLSVRRKEGRAWAAHRGYLDGIELVEGAYAER